MSNLVLWGHDTEDYEEMFDLTADMRAGRLLEYGSGPSAFNTEQRKAGREVISCCPLFALDKATLTSKAALVFADMAEKISREQDKFDFSHFGSFSALVEKRQAGMARFFADYESGKKEKRYLPAQEMALPFEDFTFDLALSSHYLFTGLDDQDLNFHVTLIKELARVAREVRIFPLIDRNGHPSPLLGPVLLALQQENYGEEVRSVPYKLQPQGNAMLRVFAKECRISRDVL